MHILSAVFASALMWTTPPVMGVGNPALVSTGDSVVTIVVTDQFLRPGVVAIAERNGVTGRLLIAIRPENLSPEVLSDAANGLRQEIGRFAGQTKNVAYVVTARSHHAPLTLERRARADGTLERLRSASTRDVGGYRQVRALLVAVSDLP